MQDRFTGLFLEHSTASTTSTTSSATVQAGITGLLLEYTVLLLVLLVLEHSITILSYHGETQHKHLQVL